jgi:hypothetical protein
MLEAILMQRFGITLNTYELQRLLSVLQTQEAVKQ